MDEVTEILKKSGLEPSVYFFENRCGGYGDFVFLGIFAAGKAVKASREKAVLDGILTLPMVMPPTVAGFFTVVV